MGEERYGPSHQPCEDCGRVGWQDWILLPHLVFNSVCPAGEGLLCFPCFVLRASEQLSRRRTEGQ